MATCFLFVHHFTDEKCLSLRLDDLGQLDAPLALRTLETFKLLQTNTRTIVVMPTESSSLHSIELPWLGLRKARIALPYALEDQVAQNVSTLHVAFDFQHYQNKHYLVTVTDKILLTDLIGRLDASNIRFDSITLDWFALNNNETCLSETSFLINDEHFRGALSAAPAAIYLANHQKHETILQFQDSNQALRQSTFKSLGESFYEWTAKRLLNGTLINLCPRELQRNTREQTNGRWYRISALLAGVWLFSFLVVNAYISHVLTNKINETDQKIAVIYRDFFPNATQVITPRFRVERLIKAGSVTHDAVLWTLLDKLADANKENAVIEQLRYQNQMLSVTLSTNDFAALEALELRLQKAQVNVTQAQASSHENQVLATLELRL